MKKKAIEELKSFKKDKDCKYWIGINGEKAIDIIINLIEKQQKEIEELANSYQANCISKDKIRELLNELEAMSVSENIYYEEIFNMIKELLGE